MNFFDNKSPKRKKLPIEAKIFLFLLWIVLLMIQIGSLKNDKPVIVEPWPPSIDYEAEAQKNKDLYYRKTSTRHVESWKNDEKQETENWNDFIEELDHLGLSVYDPEAEEIWENFK